MTNGAFAGLSIALGAVGEPGDEVIFISPPWFFYEGTIVNIGGIPVRVKINPETFDLDLQAIASAITDKTRAILINSPHNPTGKIYQPDTLRGDPSWISAIAISPNGATIATGSRDKTIKIWQSD